VAGDAIRNFTGRIPTHHVGVWPSGVFYHVGYAYVDGQITGVPGSPIYYGIYETGFDTSCVVPVGKENSVRTLSERYWRRVA
jgi:hypothetical protein